MDGEILTSAEMAEAHRHADTVMTIINQHGLNDELDDVYKFLLGLAWKDMKH